ncbi:glycosyltransferase [Vibrio sp. CAIM 722]|uniref:Glycosyltransferase n=1 Tax=Vibrio eleionomae TaxID=2653505 RepID=A0A7X4LPP4_9VIBR|nr:glycosyltransferase [Vibrio eleionomae]MZI95547.1 glycosyltransferase [Vibrio eleionomae]
MAKSKIRVCHLVYSFDVGGLERIIVNCINNLKSDNFSHIIISLTTIGDFYSEIHSPVESFALNKKAGNDISLYFRLYKLLKKSHPDVMHTYNLGTIEYQWVAWLAGVPLRVHAEHGRDSYDPDGTVKKYRWLRRITSSVIHHMVTVSADLKQWLINDVHIPSRKVSLIINGVDTEFYHNALTNGHTLDFCQGKCVFGHVARLHHIKNQHFLIQAFADACKQHNDFYNECVLVIVGDGPDRSRLENFVLQQPLLNERVFFVGSQTQVINYYQNFDVFLMSSLAEGVPMTLIESMSMSIPHLVTRVGGIKEVIIDNETGLSVESDDLQGFVDNMYRLFWEPTLRSDMGSKARKRIEAHFSQHSMIEAYEKIYQERDRQ